MVQCFCDLVEKLDQRMTKTDTEPNVQIVIKQGLLAWNQSRQHHFVMTYHPRLFQAIVQQETLGLSNCLERCLLSLLLPDYATRRTSCMDASSLKKERSFQHIWAYNL